MASLQKATKKATAKAAKEAAALARLYELAERYRAAAAVRSPCPRCGA